ncbi:MAG: hypothetical protein Q9P14_14320 [candidate division KSB1 bacterium]|nr:hypothetical protein [candidate division KSB1 bacterium]
MIMRLLEEVYATMVDSMKYTVMPPDTVINGKWYYDVYVYKLSKKIYGYVQPEKVVGDNPNSNGRPKPMPPIVIWDSGTTIRALRGTRNAI